MKLTRFRVQNFRSFVDSGWIACDDVTAVAGVNEAGKSNLLRALWKLNPAARSDNKILKNDIPLDRFDAIMDGEKMPIFITAEFRLRPYDKELIRTRFRDCVAFDHVRVSRFLSGEYLVEYPVNVPNEYRKALDDFVIKIMPGFVYYSNYGNLDSNIYLPQMLAKFNKNGVNTISKSKQRTIKLLLMYIGITPEMLVCDTPLLAAASQKQLKLTAAQLKEIVAKQAKYQKLFDDAGARLTHEFNQWWHQGEYKFEFAFDGGNLTIFVTDKNGIRAPLDDRSVGIQWFLSFFLVFSLESQFFLTNTVMLLDESGATLHGLAQQDLVAFFDELAKTNQIIYSTHSSFMLPAEHLDRTRVVYKDAAGHSLVSCDMRFEAETRSSRAAIVPVSTAVNMQVSAAVLRDSIPLIVMDKAVEIYLTSFKNFLIEIGQLTSDMIKSPLLILNSAVDGIEGTARILEKQDVLPAVLAEENLSAYSLVPKLKESYGAQSAKVVVLKEALGVNSIEDLVPFEVFANCCGNILVDNLGADFVLRQNLPFLEQLSFAPQQKDKLADLRVQMADKVRVYLAAHTKDKILRTASKNWLQLLEIVYANYKK